MDREPITLPSETLRVLRDIAAENGVSVEAVVEKLILEATQHRLALIDAEIKRRGLAVPVAH
jgi:hypothetical protein